MAKNLPSNPKGYAQLLGDLEHRIREARVRGALAVNRELVVLYWGDRPGHPDSPGS